MGPNLYELEDSNFSSSTPFYPLRLAFLGAGPLGFVGGSTDNGRMMHFVKRGQFEFGTKGIEEEDEENLAIPRRYAVVLIVSPRILC